MLKQVTVCDRCGKQDVPWDSIYAVVGTQQGVSGTEDRHEAVDLCCACLRWVMGEMVSQFRAELAAEWVKLARTPPKVVRM